MVKNQIFDEIGQAVEVALPAYQSTKSTLSGTKIRVDGISQITTISRGSSSCATDFLAQLLATSDLPIRALDPALFYEASKPTINQDEMVIALSQSGETGEVVKALKFASKKTANTFAVHNSKNSTLSNSAYWDLFINAGIEKSVPATKSVIAQLCSILAIFDWLTQSNNEAQIDRYVSLLPTSLLQSREHEIDPYKVHAVLGTNTAIPIAKEIALKMTELWGTPIWGGNALEFLHGPIAITREQNSLIYVGDFTKETLEPLKTKVAQRNLKILQSPQISNQISDLLLTLSYWQQISATSAIKIGVDPTNPFGLTKVTQT